LAYGLKEDEKENIKIVDVSELLNKVL
jgi:hypothetical protein